MEQITINDNGGYEYLRQISKPVEINDKKIHEDIKVVEDFCSKNVCFAMAPIQLGIPKRVIYIKNSTLDIPITNIEYDEHTVLINPKMISSKGEATYWEKCRSCGDNVGLVHRPYEVVFEFYDEKFIKHKKKFQGFISTILCHEYDHLDGILHMDRAEKLITIPMTLEERIAFRDKKENGYIIISKQGEFNYSEKPIKSYKAKEE